MVKDPERFLFNETMWMEGYFMKTGIIVGILAIFVILALAGMLPFTIVPADHVGIMDTFRSVNDRTLPQDCM